MRRAALAVAVVVATVMLAACQGVDGHPSPTPSFSTALPSPLPTVTLDEYGRALPGFVTTSQELPAAQPAPEGLLAQTGPGWSLQTFRPAVAPVSTVAGVVPGFDATVQVLYLVSPQGQRFQLLELDPAVPVLVDSWTAGESVAYVRQCDPLDCPADTPTQLLDLLTGELSPFLDLEGDLRIGATLPGSARWWQNGRDAAVLEVAGRLSEFPRGWIAASASPDGRYLAVTRADSFSTIGSAGLAVVDVGSGRLIDIAALWPEPLQCEPFRWRADDTLDVSCFDPTFEVWRVFAVGPGAHEMKENKSATATPPADGPWVEPDVFVTNGVWAGPFTADGDSRLKGTTGLIGIARNASFEQLVAPDATVGSARIVASISGTLYVEATQAYNPTLITLWTYDTAADAWHEIGPLPPGGPTRGLVATQGSPASGMTSYALAP